VLEDDLLAQNRYDLSGFSKDRSAWPEVFSKLAFQHKNEEIFLARKV
jgi:hypothetical protein